MIKLKLNTKVRIYAEYFDGKKELLVKKEDDLITNNMLSILALLPILRLAGDYSQYFTLIKDDGSSVSRNATLDGDNYVIAVGSGTTQPSPDDYKLELEIARSDVLNPVEISIDTSNRKVTAHIYQTISGTSNATISEAGLFVKDGSYYYLICRDTFSAVTIPSDAYASVDYYLTFQL